MKRSLVLVLLLALPAVARATTAPDLSGRVVVDGRTDEYASDEWVLAQERVDDSAWGSDNDVGAVAVTWDTNYLYIAAACVMFESRLLLLIDHEPGGAADMRAPGPLYRAISFSGTGEPFRPDVAIEAWPQSTTPAVWRLDGGLERLDDGAVRGYCRQSGLDGGALEVAIPWSLIAPSGPRIAVMAAITGDEGSGCGDAAPDPNGRLSSIRTDAATLDRPLWVTVDGDGDGIADAPVSPVDVAAVTPPAGTSDELDDVEIAVGVRSFAPDEGEVTRFTVRRARGGQAFMSARVYSRAGELITVLFADELRSLDPPFETVWDGTDRFGRVVPGGIYIVNVSWGAARGQRAGATSAAVAVVR